MNKPLVSVVIVTLNNINWLIKSLKNIYKQNYKNIEVYVVDNGSKDDTFKIIKEKFSKVKLIESGGNIGFGRAANLALKRAAGKYIFIYNDDALIEKNTLTEMVNAMESDTNLGAVQGTILFTDKKDRVESQGSFLTPIGILIKETGHKFNPKKSFGKEIFNANLPLMRKSTLDKIGYFDKDYFLYFEEADLNWRLWLAGYKIEYVPKAILYHERGATTKKIKPPRIIESAFTNRIDSLIKNLGFASLLWMLPLHLVFCFIGIFLYFIRGKFNGGFAIFKAIVNNILNLRRTLKKRVKIQKTRVVGDKELFRVMLRPVTFNYLYKSTIEYLKSW